MVWAAGGRGFTDTPTPLSPAIREDLRAFATYGTVLHVAAHPDDENTQLITYLARGRAYRTAYLSLTRGDGGQNEIGPEFSERLGVARTQELLAARRLDRGRQFFTRALDFGFSKSVPETLTFWDRQQVVGDIVRIYRTFRPDVVVTRFSPQPSGTHGHHTASAMLAVEAFKLSGDPKAFPEQLAEGLPPWQPKRILHNGWGSPAAGALVLQAGGRDAVTGETYQTIAMHSRAQHKTQGFGLRPTGSGDGSWRESFTLLAGDAATNDLMDGIEVTWNRVPGGAVVGSLVEDALANFDPANPAASVPALLKLRTEVAGLPPDPVVLDKRRQLDRILQQCLGLTVTAVASTGDVVPNETLNLQFGATATSAVPMRLNAVRVAGLAERQTVAELKPGVSVQGELSFTVPPATPLTQPYWLREEPTTGMSRVADAMLIGLPENPPSFEVAFDLEIAGQKLAVTVPVTAPTAPDGPAAAARPLAVISPVSLRFDSGVTLVVPGGRKTVRVEVRAARPDIRGTVRLETPAGWSVSPVSRPFSLAQDGGTVPLDFTLTAPASASLGDVQAVAEIGATRFTNQRVEISYPHIPHQLLQPPARLRVAAFEVAARGKAVGYLPGAGDDTAAALEQLGYRVTVLTGADLTPETLRELDAVVIGVRAFNERTDLAANLSGLFAYVEAGGTVVAQYNRPNGLKTPKLGPYALSIEGSAPQQRVTDEHAPVSLLQPDHPALTTPNRIGPDDFTGWVQERGAYFPSSWDEAQFTPILAMNDPGETPLKSSVLIARHGQGHFVYTGLAFFRQLPAGVPGAYRLFANLVSLGK